MIIDILIVLGCVSALYRGGRSGFARQLLVAAGFLGGLFLGSWLLPRTVSLSQSTDSRAVIAVVTTFGIALIGFTAAEYAAAHLKRRLADNPINRADDILGSVTAVATLLMGVWLMASIAGRLPSGGLQTALRDSGVVNSLNRVLPSAPNFIAGLSHLINPNGFPDVFIGNEPIPRGTANLPTLGGLQAAVNSSRDSVVRIKGQGCGGVVSGSGFVAGKDLVATNAHVVAGISTPFVQDANGSHRASIIYFDPNLDFAVLRAKGLAGGSLTMAAVTAARGTPAAVLGYPGGGDFNASPAYIMNRFRASGRDIYGSKRTQRDIYSVQAAIVQGDSGGPLVAADGKVIGMVFAESTNYNQVGYALTSPEISAGLKQAAAAHRQSVSTGRCAE